MDKLEAIRLLIDPILKENELRLYNLRWTKFEHKRALEISVYDVEKPVDLNRLSLISEAISMAIDESELFDFEYLLDIGTAGAEREFPLNEIEQNLNQYVFVKFKNPFMGGDSVYGTLIENDENTITIEYQVKQAKKKIQLNHDNIAKIRLAVKV